jgi:site-specific recombinase XerD
MIISTAVTQFIAFKRASGIARSSILNIESTCNLFLSMARDKDLAVVADLDSVFWNEWVGNLLESSSPSSVKLRVVLVRQFLSWCFDQGHIDDLPYIPVPKQNRNHIPDVLTMRDIDKLLEVVLPSLTGCRADRDRAMVAIMLATGIRVGELIELQAADVDAARGTCVVRCGKGMKTRVVAYDPNGVCGRWMKRHLKTITKTDQKVFGMTVANVQTVLKKVGAAAGRHISPHTLRRTWASKSLESGIPLHVVMQLGGWSDVSTLRHYVNIASNSAVHLAQKLAYV